MERPAILLDENLLWCYHEPRHYELFGQMIVENLKRMNVRGDVFFIGQTDFKAWDPVEGKWKTLKVEEELAREGVDRRTWYFERGEYHKAFTDAALDCEREVRKLEAKHGKGWHLRPENRREARRIFITCVRRMMAAAPVDSPRGASGRVPIRGVRDYDIKAWAKDNCALIVSADYGADLQPGEKSERILLKRPDCMGNMTDDAETLAKAIVERLREVRELVSGVP